MRSTARARLRDGATDYRAFDQLDGDHPWGEHVPEGFIHYPVRRLKGGKVSYFNFALAREMGMIPTDHPDELNARLEEKILDTFCVRIINEYDVAKRTRFAADRIKPKKYMATRYLQLQHADKSGRTSGDGRCIWNGVFRGPDRLWDVSSRGTGVTALAPGAVKAGAPLKSGNRDFGYGCGMADIDELLGAAILAEVFHRNEVPTERVLAIVDLGKGVGIGVRAAPNLLRPAHLFLFSKQGRREPLRRAMDYLIDRQNANGAWGIKLSDPSRYAKMLNELAASFARFTAHLERDYIFAWLDWDGDNVLADAGIIDYGSVRQFGLRHDQYRYDDVDRFSTNLNEQRVKAREMLQTFAQAVDFAETGVRRPWDTYRRADVLDNFDQAFETAKLERLLFQIGFDLPRRRLLMNRHRREVESFYRIHREFERTKTRRPAKKVADGVHRPAIFNMRMALKQMAEYLDGMPAEYTPLVDANEFFGWILSAFAGPRDRKLDTERRRQIATWQRRYLKLFECVCSRVTWEATLTLVHRRAAKINAPQRITGNALIHVVDEILRHRRKGISDEEMQAAIEELIDAATLNPDYRMGEVKSSRTARTKARAKVSPPPSNDFETNGSTPLVRSLLSVVHGFREDI